MKTTDSKYQGWIVFGVFLLAFAVAWIAGAIWGIAATQLGRSLGFNDAVISTVSLLGIAVIRGVIWIPITRMVLKRRLREMAFQFHHGWWQDLLVGIGISSLAISVIFLVAIKAGWLVIEGWIWQLQPNDVLLGKLCVSLLINALVAIVEEVAFRAYLLTGLKEAWGQSIGLAVMAVAFSLMHAPALEGYPPFTIACALLMMAAFGVMFGWVYLRTGFLWLPIGIHFAWDFVENDLLNLSGDMSNPHVVGFVTRLVGPSSSDWLGNALLLDTLTLGLIIACIFIWLRLSRNRLHRPTRART